MKNGSVLIKNIFSKKFLNENFEKYMGPSFNKLQLKNFLDPILNLVLNSSEWIGILDPILNKKIFSNYLFGDFGELGGRRQNWCFYDCFILLTNMYQNSSQNLSIVQFVFFYPYGEISEKLPITISNNTLSFSA